MSEFRLVIREAEAHERHEVVARSGQRLASDHCLLVRLGASLVGWWDDYGTFHVLPGCPGDHAEVQQAAEALFRAAAELCQQ